MTCAHSHEIPGGGGGAGGGAPVTCQRAATAGAAEVL